MSLLRIFDPLTVAAFASPSSPTGGPSTARRVRRESELGGPRKRARMELVVTSRRSGDGNGSESDDSMKSERERYAPRRRLLADGRRTRRTRTRGNVETATTASSAAAGKYTHLRPSRHDVGEKQPLHHHHHHHHHFSNLHPRPFAPTPSSPILQIDSDISIPGPSDSDTSPGEDSEEELHATERLTRFLPHPHNHKQSPTPPSRGSSSGKPRPTAAHPASPFLSHRSTSPLEVLGEAGLSTSDERGGWESSSSSSSGEETEREGAGTGTGKGKDREKGGEEEEVWYDSESGLEESDEGLGEERDAVEGLIFEGSQSSTPQPNPSPTLPTMAALIPRPPASPPANRPRSPPNTQAGMLLAGVKRRRESGSPGEREGRGKRREVLLAEGRVERMPLVLPVQSLTLTHFYPPSRPTLPLPHPSSYPRTQTSLAAGQTLLARRTHRTEQSLPEHSKYVKKAWAWERLVARRRRGGRRAGTVIREGLVRGKFGACAGFFGGEEGRWRREQARVRRGLVNAYNGRLDEGAVKERNRAWREENERQVNGLLGEMRRFRRAKSAGAGEVDEETVEDAVDGAVEQAEPEQPAQRPHKRIEHPDDADGQAPLRGYAHARTHRAISDPQDPYPEFRARRARVSSLLLPEFTDSARVFRNAQIERQNLVRYERRERERRAREEVERRRAEDEARREEEREEERRGLLRAEMARRWEVQQQEVARAMREAREEGERRLEEEAREARRVEEERARARLAQPPSYLPPAAPFPSSAAARAPPQTPPVPAYNRIQYGNNSPPPPPPYNAQAGFELVALDAIEDLAAELDSDSEDGEQEREQQQAPRHAWPAAPPGGLGLELGPGQAQGGGIRARTLEEMQAEERMYEEMERQQLEEEERAAGGRGGRCVIM